MGQKKMTLCMRRHGECREVKGAGNRVRNSIDGYRGDSQCFAKGQAAAHSKAKP